MKKNSGKNLKTKKLTKLVCKNVTRNISGKQALLMIPLTKFFCKTKNMNNVLSILNGKSKISLRIIDWFVTNYSKKYNTIYNINKYRKDEKERKQESACDNLFKNQFIVYTNYKCQLKAFSKKQFDPFCRRERICFYYNKNNSIITTVGQLNFFKWALENNVIDYINENLQEIEEDMNNSMKRVYSGRTQKKKRRTKGKKKKYAKKRGKKNQDDSDNENVKSDTEEPEEFEENNEDGVKSQRKKRRELSHSSAKSIIYHRHPTYVTFD